MHLIYANIKNIYNTITFFVPAYTDKIVLFEYTKFSIENTQRAAETKIALRF